MENGQTVHLGDDDEDDRMLIKDALEEANPNVTVIEAEDGQELIENVKNSDDLSETVVIIDMNMPKMNGIEFLQNLRKDSRFKDLKVFVITTSEEKEDKLEWVVIIIGSTQ